jgi:opacity protein-like surface antigen
MGIRARRAFALAAAVLAACLASSAFAADPAPNLADSLKNRLFLFGGFDVARDSSFGWTGIVSAPWSRLDEDGLRLRVMAGLGHYRYRTDAVAGGVNEGTVSSGEIMLGWRRAFDPTVVVVYLGAQIEDHQLRDPDPGNPVSGTTMGIKGTIELFSRPWPDYIATALASASTVHGSYQARATFAREINPWLALGVEGTILGNARYVEPRAGLVAVTTVADRKLSLSGGYLSNSDKGDGLYLTLSLYAPF